MRIRTILLTGIAATAATIGLASSAMAATTDATGVVTVTKGDIQNAMGWSNAGWDNYLSTHKAEGMGSLITTGVGNTPTAPDGGMWYLNGQTGTVTAEWLADPDNWTPQFDWTPVKQTITPESSSAKVEPILNAQKKLTGFKVSRPAPSRGPCTRRTRGPTSRATPSRKTSRSSGPTPTASTACS